MRLGFYNQMFGIDGRKLSSFLLGHWAVHFQGNERLIWRMVDINRTIDVVKKSGADIIGIAEVLEGEEEELEKGLKKLGYKYIFFAKGHRTKFRKLYIKVCLASKIKCKKIGVRGFPVKDEMGGGGGVLHCYFPKLKLDIMILHLASKNKERIFDQLDFVENRIRKLKKKIVLMGDFNEVSDDLKSYFRDLNLVTGRIKTCSDTPILKKFWFKDLDHIFIRGFKKKKAGRLIGHSDHELLYVEVD